MEMNKALKQLVDTKGYEFLKNPMIVNISPQKLYLRHLLMKDI